MKTVKTTTVTHQKVQKVLELMHELNLEIVFMGNEYRVTDLELCDKYPHLANMTLLDEEMQPAICLPPLSDFKLQVFE